MTTADYRFAARLPGDEGVNPLTRLLDDKRQRGEDILDLTRSNPTRAGLAVPGELVADALGKAENRHYDPKPLGMPSAREAVAQYYREKGASVDPARVVLTCSTSEAYAQLFRLLCDPDDELLAPRPSYPLLDFLAAMQNVVLRPYRLLADHNWRLDFASLERQLGPRSRGIVLVNPNNPTGSYLRRDELATLQRLASERSLPLIIDEVFADYRLDPAPDIVPGLAKSADGLAFVVSGLSKVSALPQMKLGWIVVAGGPAAAEALGRLEVIADTFLSVSTPVQHAAGEFLAARHDVQRQTQARLETNLAAWRREFDGTPARVFEPQGGWYAVARFPATRSDEEWALAALAEANVLVHPGYLFDFEEEGYIVASLLTPPAELVPGVKRLAALICG